MKKVKVLVDDTGKRESHRVLLHVVPASEPVVGEPTIISDVSDATDVSSVTGGSYVYVAGGEALFSDVWLPMLSYAGDKTGVKQILPQGLALTQPYIAVNTDKLENLLVVDCDHDRWRDILIEYSGVVPSPGFVAVNRVSGCAHLCWVFANPICRSQHRNSGVVFDSIAVALQKLFDGDVAYSSVFMKNPLHDSHDTYWGDANGFGVGSFRGTPNVVRLTDMRVLRAGLEDAGVFEYVKRGFTPVWERKKQYNGESSNGSGGFREDYADCGRNCFLFEHTRFDAYRLVKEYTPDQSAAFFQRMIEVIEDFQASDVFTSKWGKDNSLSGREIVGIARSISKWTMALYSYRNTNTSASCGERKRVYKRKPNIDYKGNAHRMHVTIKTRRETDPEYNEQYLSVKKDTLRKANEVKKAVYLARCEEKPVDLLEYVRDMSDDVDKLCDDLLRSEYVYCSMNCDSDSGVITRKGVARLVAHNINVLTGLKFSADRVLQCTKNITVNPTIIAITPVLNDVRVHSPWLQGKELVRVLTEKLGVSDVYLLQHLKRIGHSPTDLQWMFHHIVHVLELDPYRDTDIIYSLIESNCYKNNARNQHACITKMITQLQHWYVSDMNTGEPPSQLLISDYSEEYEQCRVIGDHAKTVLCDLLESARQKLEENNSGGVKKVTVISPTRDTWDASEAKAFFVARRKAEKQYQQNMINQKANDIRCFDRLHNTYGEHYLFTTPTDIINMINIINNYQFSHQLPLLTVEQVNIILDIKHIPRYTKHNHTVSNPEGTLVKPLDIMRVMWEKQHRVACLVHGKIRYSKTITLNTPRKPVVNYSQYTQEHYQEILTTITRAATMKPNRGTPYYKQKNTTPPPDPYHSNAA